MVKAVEASRNAEEKIGLNIRPTQKEAQRIYESSILRHEDVASRWQCDNKDQCDVRVKKDDKKIVVVVQGQGTIILRHNVVNGVKKPVYVGTVKGFPNRFSIVGMVGRHQLWMFFESEGTLMKHSAYSKLNAATLLDSACRFSLYRESARED